MSGRASGGRGTPLEQRPAVGERRLREGRLDGERRVEQPGARMSVASAASSEPRLALRLGAFYFASFATLGLNAPYFPLWLESHGFRGAPMGAIAALSPGMSFFGPPLVGLLSDARGARGNLLSAACALSCSALIGLSLCELLGTSSSFGVVFAAVLVYAACRSPMILLVDRITIEHGGDYGRRRVWGSVGFMLAAIAFGRWCPPESTRWLPAAMATTLAIAFVLSLSLPRATLAARALGGSTLGSARSLFEQRRFVAFLLGSALSAASHSCYDLCGALFFRDLGASKDTIGLLYGTAVLAEIALLAGAGPLWSRVRPELVLMAAYAGAALRWACLSLLASTSLAFLLQPLHAVSFGLMWMASLEYVRRVSTPEVLGSAQGAFMAANAGGGVLGMLSWGPLYASHGGPFVFRLAALLSLAAAALLGAGFSRARAPGGSKAPGYAGRRGG
jgi:PPP family 3-phenylpropionic acid transporter